MNSETEQPAIRVIHHMARSGGTIICRCLASMEGVVLLSEIHPLGLRMFNPLQQADEWHGLMTEADATEFAARPLGFADAIVRIADRCREQGKILVIRDWSHLDYTGVPFVKPAYRSLLVDSLQQHFRVKRFSTVRHPVDQWLSITRNPQFKSRLDAAEYVQGCLRFAQEAGQTGFIRYEDFTGDTDHALKKICAALDIPFDPAYRDRWQDWDRITGDVMPGRAGQVIRSLPRQDVEAADLDAISRQPVLNEVMDLLGYAAERDPGPRARL